MARRHATRWTVGFGTWWGVDVRLHMLLVLFAVVTLSVNATGGMLPVSGIFLTILIASVALHELAHTIAAIKLGGEVDEVVLTPIGGLRAPRVPDEPEPQVFVALVGPMTNLAIVVLMTGVLVLLKQTDFGGLFYQLAPLALVEGPLLLVAIKLTLWINWALFLVNMLPAYPFDGGPALRAVLWPLLGRRSAAVATAYTARGVALALCCLAVLVIKNEIAAAPTASIPLWIPLVTLSVFLFFSSQQDLAHASSLDLTSREHRRELALELRPDDDLFVGEWDESGDDMVLVEHAQQAKQMQREAKRRAEEAYEDARVDDILARLHRIGIEDLTDEERHILQRASQRYRQRQTADQEPSEDLGK